VIQINENDVIFLSYKILMVFLQETGSLRRR